MKRLNIAVVGCGAIAGEFHIPNVLFIPVLRLAALADSNLERLRQMARKFNVSADHCHQSIQILLAGEDCQAVLICTPAATHADIACQCMEAGKHVFVEKPIAPTVAEAERMIATARRRGVKLMVGHYLRYMPHHIKAREMMRAGQIGKVFSAQAYEETLGIKPDEGIITDLAPHYIDLLCFYFEESRVEKVFAHATRHNARPEDRETEAEIKMFFANGVTADIHVYWVPGFGNWDACERYIRLVGGQGFIRTGLTNSAIRIYKATSRLNRMRGPYEFVPRFVLHPDMPVKGTSFRKEIEDFADAVLNNHEPPITGETALVTVKIVEAALRSAASMSLVSLD